MNSKILIFVASFLLFACSSTQMYKNKLVPAGNHAATTKPYGSYVEVTSREGIYAGEYIAFQNDTLYVLSLNEMHALNVNNIEYVNLVLTRTKTKNYVIGTGIAVIPSLIGAAAHPDYAGEFLTIGGITALSGSLAALIESSRKAQEEHINGNTKDIKKSTRYARFPKGIPPGVDPYDLKLTD